MVTSDISFISIQNRHQGFPKHFHDTFCISLIRKGIENLELEDRLLYSEAGNISITNPYELHANPLVDRDKAVSFDTLYVSGDLMKHLLGTTVLFENRQIEDVQLNRLFTGVIKELQSENPIDEQATLKQFVQRLHHLGQVQHELPYAVFKEGQFAEIIGYIDQHLDDKIELEQLARIAALNKFGFVRKFKTITGMTPINYVLMKKIFAAKEQIGKFTDLTDLAYSYQFADLPHFSHAFKKYVGISPNDYKKQYK